MLDAYSSKRATVTWVNQTVIVVRAICLFIPCLVLCGCNLGGAPSYSIFGAFFPAWLLCATAGLLGSVILRSLIIGSGLEEAMPFKLLVYVAFAVGLSLSLWLFLFGER
jgi:hypothetical protein